MLVADPLFGAFEIPSRLEALLAAPEVQRLRDVRLINTSTPNLAALSDIKRYTHTLGVLALALAVAPQLRQRHSHRHVEALLAATILHDVGSPAFAHLFEYLLKSSTGWTHESMLEHIIAGDYRPESTYHQVYYGHSLKLKSILENMELDSRTVLDNVMGEGPLGRLLAGTVDLDNIDNVYRMSCALGLHPRIEDARLLVGGLDVDEIGLRLCRSTLQPLESWRILRRKAYEILVFDESALQSQAMLTECFSSAIDSQLIGEEHWYLTDDQILTRMASARPKIEGVSSTVQRFLVGDFFSTIYIGWYGQPQGAVDLRAPEHRERLRARLQDRLGIPCSPYIFYDKGTFEKKLEMRVAVDDGAGAFELVETGQTSTSTLAAVFTSRRIQAVSRRQRERVVEVLEEFGLLPEFRNPIPTKGGTYGIAGQAELSL